MPTTKPRISVTVDRRVYETIERLAKLQRRSRSKVVVELLESIHEPLMRTVALLDAAADAPEEVKRGFRGVVESVEAQLVAVAGGAIAQQDWLLRKLQKGASAHSAGERRSERQHARKAVATPVVVIRGSGRGKGGRKR